MCPASSSGGKKADQHATDPRQEIVAALHLFRAGGPVEINAKYKDGEKEWVSTGVFTDYGKAADAILALDEHNPQPVAVWHGLHHVKTQRVTGRFSKGGRRKAEDVVSRAWLFIDCDRREKDGKSKSWATAAELAECRTVRDNVVAFLAGAGALEPVLVASANGYQAFVPLDNLDVKDPAVEAAVAELHALLDERLGTATVKIDPSVADLPRVAGIPGTLSRKFAGEPRRVRLETDPATYTAKPATLEVLLHAIEQLKLLPKWKRDEADNQIATPAGEIAAAPAGEGKHLLDFAMQDTTLRKKNAKELCGPCPFPDCDADDNGFNVIVNEGLERWNGLKFEGVTGRFLCRKCGRTGNAVEYLMMRHSMTRAKAMQALGLDARKVTTATPASGSTAAGDAQGEDAPPLQSLPVKRAIDLMGREFAPLKWIIPDILPEGYAVLVGRPKLGKSYLALDWCVAVAAGGYAMGERKCDRREVLYCGLEDSERRLQSRLREVIGADQIPAALHYLAAGEMPRFGNGGMELLDAFLSEHPGVGLVVIDTYARVRPPKPKHADPYVFDYENGAALADLARRHGVSILCVLHARKAPSEDFIDEASGTLGIAGAADVILVMRRARGSQDVALHYTGKDVPEVGLGVRFDPRDKSWRIVGTLAEVQQSSEWREVCDLLKDGRTYSPAQIAAELGVSVGSMRHRLRKMAEQGAVEQAGYGKYHSTTMSKMIHSVHSIHSDHSVHSVHSSTRGSGKSEQSESKSELEETIL